MSETLEALRKEINRCNRCGTCRSVCPIFRELKGEQFVARGKLQLISALGKGELALTPHLEELLQLCLLCKACVSACPSQVPVDRLVMAARAEVVRRKGQPALPRLIYRQLLPYRGRLRAAGGMLAWYQRSSLQRFLRRSGVLKRLPGDLAPKERLLPQAPRQTLTSQLPAVVKALNERGRVAYFIGCATNLLFPDTGRAVVEVLTRNGITVLIPPMQCCGIPARSGGDEETARKLAAMNLEWFKTSEVDAVVVDCASCGSTLRGYGEFLGTPEAAAFSAKVRDISEYLVDTTDFAHDLHPVPGRVTYHDPCHLVRGQKVAKQPRAILQAIPGLELVEMREADKCCGSAGSFFLSHYPLAMQVTARKTANIAATGATLVATACPSCRMQLAHGLAEQGMEQPVMHVVELLARSYRNE